MFTSRRKKRLKALIIRYELPFYLLTAALYGGAILLAVIAFPDVSNTVIAVLLLVSGFTASVGSMASAIKSDDTLE